MGRTEWGTWSLAWKAPDYEVDEDGKIAGLVNDRHPHNWGRWGDLDERGTANFITPDIIKGAKDLIVDGRIISMAIPLDATGPSHPTRPGVRHYWGYTGADMIAGTAISGPYPKSQATDDYINMPLQASTQWDGLSHFGYADSLYNGFWIGNVETISGANRCSIMHMKESLCGRGVLLDVARHKGVDRLEQRYAITPKDLDEVIEAQGVEIREGDIMIVRTGHVAWWYTLETPAERLAFFDNGAPGISMACVEWIHEKSIAAIAMDNVAIEVEPPEKEGDGMYPVHARLIRDMGLSLGEIWNLEPIAEDCAKDGRYEFFVAAQPLRVTNGSGSPLNPIAIK